MRESALLQHIYQANPRLGGHVIIPPGDDMGAIRIGREIVLATVDQLVDGRHFRLRSTPLALIGRKAVARSLSDVAAMASEPLATLAAATLPPDFGEERANELFDAMRATCDEFHSPLIGGDIAMHADNTSPLVLSVTVLATTPPRQFPIRRDGAKPGDTVYVTGPLGGSLQPDGLGRHLTFEPRIRLGIELAKQLGDRLHAMIDISDGLGRDASHIAEMSDVQIVLDAAAIPCNPNRTWKQALGDGEDYELLFCAADAEVKVVDRTLMHRVGTVVARRDPADLRVIVMQGQNAWPADALGWEHRA